MLELLVAVLLGSLAGALTGSIPGLHPNTVIFLSFPLYFSTGVSLPLYICFVSGISVSHTFHDFLPAIYLSAPSAESAVASLPGAEMLQEGRGQEAFQYTLIGGLFAVIIFALVTPLLFLSLRPIYSHATVLMPGILLFFLLFILLRNFGTISIVVSLLSASLGILAFRMPVNQNFVLMPVFTGLFAVPAMLEAAEADLEVPEQEDAEASFPVKGGLVGFFSGLIAGTIPGVGAGAATSFLSPLIDEREEVLTGLGAVNTTDIFVSLIALFLIGKARSGPSVALQALGTMDFSLLATSIGAGFLAAGLSFPLALTTHDLYLKSLRLVELEKILLLVLLGVSGLTFVFTGLQGLLILFTASCIGLLAWRGGCRVVTMSVLIVPALLFYLGVGIFI